MLRYEDVVAVAGDPALFTTTVQNVVPKVAFTGRRPPLHLDPPEHTPYRRALNPYFKPEKIAAFEPTMREIVGDPLRCSSLQAEATSARSSPIDCRGLSSPTSSA